MLISCLHQILIWLFVEAIFCIIPLWSLGSFIINILLHLAADFMLNHKWLQISWESTFTGFVRPFCQMLQWWFRSSMCIMVCRISTTKLTIQYKLHSQFSSWDLNRIFYFIYIYLHLHAQYHGQLKATIDTPTPYKYQMGHTSDKYPSSCTIFAVTLEQFLFVCLLWHHSCLLIDGISALHSDCSGWGGGHSHTWRWWEMSSLLTSVFDIIVPLGPFLCPTRSSLSAEKICLSPSHLVPEITWPKVGLFLHKSPSFDTLKLFVPIFALIFDLVDPFFHCY